MIPTAEEYLRSQSMNDRKLSEVILNTMIEFAKMHVTEALKQAYEKADLDFIYTEYGGNEPDAVINKESILTAYPLQNIK